MFLALLAYFLNQIEDQVALWVDNIHNTNGSKQDKTKLQCIVCVFIVYVARADVGDPGTDHL